MTTEQPLIATDASGVIYGHKTFDSAPLGMTTIKAPVQEGQIFSLPELIQERDRLRAALQEFMSITADPMEDDAAAFRLALLLSIAVWRDDDLIRVGTLCEAFVPGADVAAIARRLIVRAASMCGKPPNVP